ncbi:hypothetical protein ACS0TY_027396 [Phlomoides rotata]
MNSTLHEKFRPEIGIHFDSLDEAWKFWVDYGGKIDFGVRKHYFNKSKKTSLITSYVFVCCKEGVRKQDKRDVLPLNPRLETRTDCKVRMRIKHVDVQGHEIDLAEDAGLKQKSSFQLMSRHAGGREGLGYTRIDAKNYLRSKRQRSMVYGEVGCLMRYFQNQLSKNPSFYHANQMDMEEQVTNVFWADARMLIDYEYFGDVVSLDTTLEFETRQKLPRLKLESSPMLRQLSEIYTPTIFHLFQTEFDLFAAAYIKYKNEAHTLFEYVVGLIDEDGEWRVTFDPNTKMISCSCRKFEMIGLLCCHAVKVYDVMDVKKLPEHYILKRWTREARSGVVHNYIGSEVEEDPKLQSTERYRKLCMMFIRLATEAFVHPSTFSLVHEAVCDLSKQVMKMRLTEESQDNNDSVEITSTRSFMTRAKGFKKKIGLKRSRRMKSWVELQKKKRKTNSSIKDLRAHDTLSASCSAPPVPQGCLQINGSQLNFTELLMAPLDHPQYSLESMGFNGDISNKFS